MASTSWLPTNVSFEGFVAKKRIHMAHFTANAVYVGVAYEVVTNKDVTCCGIPLHRCQVVLDHVLYRSRNVLEDTVAYPVGLKMQSLLEDRPCLLEMF